MSKTLRSSIGLILLISTVGIASCQSMLSVISTDKANTKISVSETKPSSLNN